MLADARGVNACFVSLDVGSLARAPWRPIAVKCLANRQIASVCFLVADKRLYHDGVVRVIGSARTYSRGFSPREMIKTTSNHLAAQLATMNVRYRTKPSKTRNRHLVTRNRHRLISESPTP